MLLEKLLYYCRSICVQQQVGDILPQLVQLREGLSTCTLLDHIKLHPKLWESVFLPDIETDVSGSMLLEQLEPKYNASQLKRNIVTDVFFHFCEFVHSLQCGGKIKHGENPNTMNSLVIQVIKS